jgi:hypothetical protein
MDRLLCIQQPFEAEFWSTPQQEEDALSRLDRHARIYHGVPNQYENNNMKFHYALMIHTEEVAPVIYEDEKRIASPQRWPVLGFCSFLGVPLGAIVGFAAGMNSADLRVGLAIGVLSSAVIGMIVIVGSRVRQERWPWLGIVGALVSAAPLAWLIVAVVMAQR